MDTQFKAFSGILLAGGKSSRMGEDKAFLRYQDRCLYEYSLGILENFSHDILISSSNPLFNSTRYRIVADEIKAIGPAGGIYSCLKQVKNKAALVLPCDLPLITNKVIEFLFKESKTDYINIVLNHQNQPESLIGIYPVSILPVLHQMISSHQYKLQELFKLVKTNFIKIPGITPEIFRNINFPEDFDSLPYQNI